MYELGQHTPGAGNHNEQLVLVLPSPPDCSESRPCERIYECSILPLGFRSTLTHLLLGWRNAWLRWSDAENDDEVHFGGHVHHVDSSAALLS